MNINILIATSNKTEPNLDVMTSFSFSQDTKNILKWNCNKILYIYLKRYKNKYYLVVVIKVKFCSFVFLFILLSKVVVAKLNSIWLSAIWVWVQSSLMRIIIFNLFSLLLWWSWILPLNDQCLKKYAERGERSVLTPCNSFSFFYVSPFFC